jgi:hypothetical protein
MNSLKKIALAVVAAMTTATIVASPASAAVMTVAVSLDGTANTTASAIATPAALPVPADNTVDAADALKFVATVDTGTSVTVSTTNATIVSALHTSAAPVSASSGSSSLTVATGTGTTATFYVYTKTTAIGTVTITNQGTTLTYYVQGTAGKINTLALSSADAGTTSSVVTATVTATDVFGNKVSGKGLTALVVGGTLDTTTATTGATLTNFGQADFKVTLPTTGSSTLVVSVTNSSDVASVVTGFNTVTSSVVKTITVRDLLGELAAEKAAKDAAIAAKAAVDAALAKAVADAATAAAKATADAVAAKAAADADKASAVKAEVDKAAAAAKVASDALAAKDAQIAKLTADNAAAIKSLKDAFNKLARQWNAKNPKAKVKLVK